MNERAQLKRRLEISARLTLLAGALVSTAIYLTASQEEQNALVNEFRESKAYRHGIEAYGGKLGVVSDELTRWFISLWQGEALAFTVAAVATVTALLLFRVARHIPAADQPVGHIDNESKG